MVVRHSPITNTVLDSASNANESIGQMRFINWASLLTSGWND